MVTFFLWESVKWSFLLLSVPPPTNKRWWRLSLSSYVVALGQRGNWFLSQSSPLLHYDWKSSLSCFFCLFVYFSSNSLFLLCKQFCIIYFIIAPLFLWLVNFRLHFEEYTKIDLFRSSFFISSFLFLAVIFLQGSYF